MNREFLGDALDWWKGRLFAWMIEGRFLRDLRVVPCLTDPERWHPDDFLLYSELVGIAREDISESADEDAGADLFFDPDTGIKTGRVPDEGKYLSPLRLSRALRANPNRVAAVFQYARGKTRKRVERVIAVLQEADREASFCSSESGTVAMIFASHHSGRIQAIHAGLIERFRRKGDERVGLWLRSGAVEWHENRKTATA